VDVMATSLIWISIGVALILLIQDQACKITDFAQAQARVRESVAEEIREVCGDEESVAFYERFATKLPDNLVYYALAETRQRQAADGTGCDDGAGAYFAQAIVRLAAENGCRVDAAALA